MAKTQIKDYVFKPGISATAYVYPDGYSLLSQNKAYIQAEATSWISAQVLAGASGFVGYTFNESKCQRDVGYIIDAYLNDIRYGGNEETSRVTGYYWEGTTSQLDGDRQPEILTHTEIRDIINTYVLTNTAHTSLSSSSQVIDSSKTTESGVTTRITELSGIVIGVITTGLSAMPTLVPTGVTTIKVQGRYKGEDLLLITNTTKNEIIYNFATNELGATVKYKIHGADTDFPKYLQITDSITTLILNKDTSSHASTDDVQMFVESEFIRTKPYDFGVDAIERQRMAAPLAMLDADFEYGLQPTKWSAIGTLRGYPSIYEIPGTNTDVQTVTTDASTGTSGVGQSLITVTTTSPHGFGEGAPITIKALENSIAGAARAEGSFVINTVPTTLTFTYFAKAKVGASSGEVLATSYTQLRKAGFYTGAAIGSPQLAVAIQGFTVIEQGSSGVITSELITATGSTRVPFDGVSPTIGAPLVNASIPTGSQVTGVIDQSAGGGSFLTPDIAVDTPSGSTSITLVDATGVVPNLAFDNGTGTAIYIETVNADTKSITLSSPTTAPYIGNVVTYAGLNGTNYVPAGSGLALSITSDGTDFTLGAISSLGINYQIGDRFRLAGNELAGSTPANDLVMRVTTINAAGGVTGLVVVSGTPGDGTGTFTGLTPAPVGGTGTGATFAIEFTNNVFATSTITGAGGHLTMDEFSAADSSRTAGTYTGVTGTSAGSGVVGTFNIVVGSGGAVTSVVVATSKRGHTVNDTITIADAVLGGGGAANFTMDVATISSGTSGSDYTVNDRITFLGSTFSSNGVDGTHDLVITVSAVNGSGGITGITQTGTAPDTVFDYAVSDDSTEMVMSAPGSHLTINNIGAADSSRTAGTYLAVTGTSGGSGSVGTFNITVSAAGAANVTVASNIGSGHTAGDTITIADNNLGSGGAAALTFDVATVGSGNGQNAAFTVRTNGLTYSVINITPGDLFTVGEKITVPGNILGGATPANDLTIIIDTVTGAGGLQGVSPSGVALNSRTLEGQSGTNTIGTGFIADISSSGGTYSIDFDSPGDGGSNYGLNQTFVIPGNTLNGITPANDLTITITGVVADDSTAIGEITTVTIAGTANTGTGTFTGATPNNINVTGTSPVFTITRTSDDSTGVYENINGSGVGYNIGDKVTIPGTLLGGQSPANNLTLMATSANFNASGIQIISGTPVQASVLNLLCTFTMTEATTASIARSTNISFEALATLEVDFPNAHGLVPGSSFIVTQNSDDQSNNHNLAAGAFIATDIPALDKLRYQARAAGTIDVGSSDIIGVVYPRPDSFFIHRPFDGGVQLGTGGPQHGAQAIRQSKKYIRYQSGKGIMYTTGALLAPSYDLQSVTSAGVELNSLITVTTDDNDHGCQVGGIVRLIGIETAGYNSGPGNSTPPDFDYTVVGIVDERSFTIRSKRRLGATVADLGFNAQMSVVTWHGATVRAGVFDDQNGIFWEYDGTNVNVVQRTGTFQLAGTIAMLADANLITGTSTKFTKQLKSGDRVIIKGMTHVVNTVTNDTSITVTPDFRGVNDITGAKMMYITDKKVKQADFNIDKLDGTGKSGYVMDPAKMQMIGIQYSWYGAGFIDYMVRGADGNFIYSHRMRNSNVNTEAFMRSGNLPVRYEVTNEGPPGQLNGAISGSITTIPLVDASFFPSNGTIYIDNEIITFSGVSGNNLTGCVRQATFSNYQAGATRSYTAGVASAHTDKTGVVLISSTITPLISHWGSAFITDGGFDEDRGYIFSYPETNIAVSTIKQTAFLLRLSPSVSNAIIGDLGERELLNRAQLLLNGIEITSDAGDGKGIIIEGVLNPQNYPTNPDQIGWSGLAGLAQGGQPSFAQIASGSSVEWSTGVAATTASATALATTTGVLDSGQYSVGNNNSYIFVSATDYRATFGDNNIDTVLGKNITGTNIRNGSIIDGGYISNSGNYGYFYITQRTTGGISANSSGHFTITLNNVQINSNKALFDQSSFVSSAATNGTSTTGGSVTWPAGTLVNNIALKTWGGTTYYEVTFNNTFTGTLANGSGTIEFTFDQPPYALPGETVFSFIAIPGERSTQDLSALKEITNTPLGGRGTFPNGPDVLAINVYKISGTTTNANILLKWGEAQA